MHGAVARRWKVFRFCNLDDIIASKAATNRQKDRESLPRLRSFRVWRKTQTR